MLIYVIIYVHINYSRIFMRYINFTFEFYIKPLLIYTEIKYKRLFSSMNMINSLMNISNHNFWIRDFIHAYHCFAFQPSGPFSYFKKETQINIVIVDWIKFFFIIKTTLLLKTVNVSCFVHEKKRTYITSLCRT